MGSVYATCSPPGTVIPQVVRSWCSRRHPQRRVRRGHRSDRVHPVPGPEQHWRRRDPIRRLGPGRGQRDLYGAAGNNQSINLDLDLTGSSFVDHSTIPAASGRSLTWHPGGWHPVQRMHSLPACGLTLLPESTVYPIR